MNFLYLSAIKFPLVLHYQCPQLNFQFHQLVLFSFSLVCELWFCRSSLTTVFDYWFSRILLITLLLPLCLGKSIHYTIFLAVMLRDQLVYRDLSHHKICHCRPQIQYTVHIMRRWCLHFLGSTTCSLYQWHL